MKKNKIASSQAKEAIEKMKYEIANELGITLDNNSRINKTLGDKSTKRLIKLDENQYSDTNYIKNRQI